MIELHEAHVLDWMKSFFRFPRLPKTIPVSIPEADDRFWQFAIEPMWQPPPISEGLIPMPPVWEGTEVHRMSDEITDGPIHRFYKNWIDYINNPHRVTAEQVGVYTKDVEIDPNVIDVEAREVKEQHGLPRLPFQDAGSGPVSEGSGSSLSGSSNAGLCGSDANADADKG